jgi:hypothetical protein
MPLDTSSKRRSSVGLLQPWQANAPSPSDSPGVIDRADREQIAWTYSGIHAAHPVPIPHGMHASADRLRLGRGLGDRLRRGAWVPRSWTLGQATHSTWVY